MATRKKPASGLKFFSDDSAGIRIQPKTVLIMSLIYIGIVVLLHITSKLGGAKPAAAAEDIPQKPDTASTQGQQQQAQDDTL